MNRVIWIPEKFPSLNEYITAERRNRFLGAKMKKEWTELVVATINVTPNIKAMIKDLANHTGFPTSIKFIVHEQNSRRDIDNVSAMVAKFSLDGLVKSGVLPDDSQKYINRIEFEFIIDGKNGVEIIL